ncbi:uncharacterized protein [Phyllobates terribilis]|uniref:uncharacterized protein n=1 Tax=Phyllobates terribilis TaxID=111132 RepID=UPI003CCAFB3A
MIGTTPEKEELQRDENLGERFIQTSMDWLRLSRHKHYRLIEISEAITLQSGEPCSIGRVFSEQKNLFFLREPRVSVCYQFSVGRIAIGGESIAKAGANEFIVEHVDSGGVQVGSFKSDRQCYFSFAVGSVPAAGTSGVIDRFGMPSRTMESSLRAVRNLISQSSSTRTWSSYEVAWQLWEGWKFAMGDPLESDSLLLLLVGHCWEEGWSVPKINNFMAGLAFSFKIRGLPDVTKAILVRQALKGWRKGWKVRDWRQPISYGLLLTLGELLASVCKSPWEIGLFRLAFSLAFFWSLHLGELVSPSRFVSGGLSKEDVNLYLDRIEVFIRLSKMDQFKKGCKVVLFAVAGSDMCLVLCVREFGLGPGGHKSPLLVHEDGSFLSGYEFLAVLKKCLEAGSILPKEYGGHSFRIGAATEAARRGLGDELVKKIGQWESIRFRSYIRPALL